MGAAHQGDGQRSATSRAVARHRRLMEVFRDAVAVTPPERAAVLDRTCGDDTALRTEVEALLQHHESSTPVDTPAVDPGRAVPAAADRFAELPQIPGYRLLRLVGEGGMGMVYEAEQERPQRRVAIKVQRPLASAEALRRFERESDALARLHHPGIATIHAAGTVTPSGSRRPHPYFVMEFVEGHPLDEFCRRTEASVEDRIRLVQRISEAVHHAHLNGVVHRDLKPSNILVVGDAAPGRPKVLDFGVARLEDEADTMQTEAGRLVGTLRFMSPEQLGGDRDAVDARTDVYALGTVLYELLAGRPPLDLAGRSLGDVLERLRHEEPMPLGRVDRRFQGDVEAVVARAMDKDRERRYESAAAFGHDLGRLLDDEPVTARRLGPVGRARRFARRNRGTVTAVAAIFLLLLTGLGGTIAGLIAVQRQRDLATRNFSFLTRMLFSADAQREYDSFSKLEQKPLEPPSLREVLDRAADNVAEMMANEPEAEIEIRTLLGRAFAHLGAYDSAEEQLRLTLEVMQRVDGAVNERQSRVAWNLCVMLKSQGRFDEEIARLALLALPSDDGTGMAEGFNSVAMAKLYAGQVEEAITDFESALEGLRAGDNTDPYFEGAILHNLGQSLARIGRFDEAEARLREAAAVNDTVLDPTHRESISLRNDLAWTLHRAGRHAEAEPIYAAIVDDARAALGDDWYVSVFEHGYGNCLAALGRTAEAEELLLNAAAALERQRGPGSPQTIRAWESVVDLYVATNRPTDADAARRRLDAARSAPARPAAPH